MKDMYYNIEATSTVVEENLTIYTKHEIVNTTNYETARAAFKKLCRAHDVVVYNAYDLNVPGWSTTAVGGQKPYLQEVA